MTTQPIEPGYKEQHVYEDYRQQQNAATTTKTTTATTTVIIAQQQQPHNNHVVQQQTDFKDYPVAIKCHTCHQEGLTMTEHRNGQCTYCVTCLTCLALPLGCAIIPFMMDSLKDVVHTCRFCNSLISIYKR